MTRNEVSIIKNAVLDATEAYVDARLANADFVKTQIGVVTNSSRNDKGKWEHTVVCNKTASSRGITYTKVLSVGNTNFSNDSIVFLIAPNAQYSNQFILGKLDSTPIEFVGGSIYIGEIEGSSPLDYYFSVNKYGQVSIKHPNSNIKLNYNTTYNNYNFIVDSNGLKLGITGNNSWNFTVNNSGTVIIRSGSINLNYNTTVQDYNFKVDTTGIHLGVTGTSTSTKAYNFIVDNSGVVTIRSGSITLSNKLKIDSSGWLAIGGTTSSANFYVSNTGTVTIKSGSILLNEYGSTGHYNVDINSSGLGLGWDNTNSRHNFTVNNNGTVVIRKGDIYLGTGSTSGGYAFSVSNAGYLESVSGKIGGFTIQSDYIGDIMGSTDAVGMKAGECLYAYNPSHFAKIDKGMITTAGDQGDPSIYPYCYYAYSGVTNGLATGSYLRMSSANVFSSARNDTVAWLNDISDKRLKKNISEISSLDIRILFSKIKPSKFKFKKHAKDYDEKKEDDNIHFGIIAQELKDALESSNLLTESIVKERKCTEDDDILTVNYSEFHGLELAGIKDLYNIVKDQQEQINALKAQIEEENNG